MKIRYLLIPVALLAALYGVWMWFFCRIHVPAGYMAIVTAKVGEKLSAGQILAERHQQGVWSDPLPEGRYFLNPINYSWRIVKVLMIPVGKVAVVTSKVGKELPAGEILTADRLGKGVWKDVLGPGVYRLNPAGYDATLLDAINIPIGYVGIVTSQTGKPVKPGEFAGPGEQGVMKDVLQPGLYYINPRAYQVDVLEVGMNQVSILGRTGSVVITKSQIASAGEALDALQQNTIQSQQQKRNQYLESNKDRGFISQQALSSSSSPAAAARRSSKTAWDQDGSASPAPQSAAPVPESAAFALQRFVEFPSRDGFQILLDMTVEFELLPEHIARIYMLYGDLPAVVEKIILPQVLSISRLKGSTYKARDFIDGEGRQVFQKELKEELVKILGERHIVVHNAIIRHVEVPNAILTPIQEASKAKEQDLTNKARQETARKQAELNTQTGLVEQSRRQVEQETEKLVATIAAETKNSVASLRADTEREVARINLERSLIQAKITQVRGEAEVQAEFMVNDERAKGQQLRASVFKDPVNLANLQFVDSLNPDLDIRILHAGEGTLWTDMKGLMPTVPLKK